MIKQIQPGLYGERSILGAKVRIISSPGYDIFGGRYYDDSKVYLIQKIEYRVDISGKIRPGITLEGLPNRRFLPEDLCIIELSECNNNDKNIDYGEESKES